MSIFDQEAKNPVSTETPSAGSHPAVLIAILDCGSHEEEFDDEKTKTKVKKMVRKVYLLWELTTEKMSGMNRNHVLGRDYTLSWHKKAGLRKMVEAWRGRAFNEGEKFTITKLLGVPCLLTVKHTTSGENVYAKIEGVSQLPKGMTAAKPSYPLIAWEIDDGKPFPNDLHLPWRYGRPLVKWLEESPEWKAKTSAAPAAPPAAAPEPEPAMAGAGADEAPF